MSNTAENLMPIDVLDFWFDGSAKNPRAAAERMSFWFQASDEADAAIKERFAECIEPAATGEYSSWGAKPHDCLALIILLDQFPRNLYRGTGEAFAHDALSLGLTVVGERLGYLDELSPVEQIFFLMPYQHVEDRERQHEGIALYNRLAESCPEPWRALAEGCRDFAQLHLDIIEQFGRFPHRNAALGRESTAEELKYLADGAESFGQNQ